MARPAKRTPLPADQEIERAATAGEHGVAERAALDLDRLIHERMRLGIVSALAVNERLTFNDLKSLLRTTDGNLSVHARKLEEAGYVRCEKSFVGRLPKTEFRLTAQGKRALERYLDHMEAIIHATRAPEGADGAPGRPPGRAPE
jgi:DNA-binding MarR family transcriptional regulator